MRGSGDIEAVLSRNDTLGSEYTRRVGLVDIGWTWELTAINLPANLIDDVPPLRERWVVPQVVAYSIGICRAP